MNAGRHSKIQPPGHEAVHVCGKCGWRFPNSHPSARLRRAHKKICGTIGGYKVVDSNGFDDERHSDEDYKTPSPGLMEKSVNERGNSGIGGRSNKSKDDMFANAATEFSGGSGLSPGVDVDGSAMLLLNFLVEDRINRRMTYIVQPSSSSTDNNPVESHEIPDSTTDHLVSTLKSQDNVPASGSIVSSVYSHVEEQHTILASDSNSALRDPSLIKSEKPADDTAREIEANSGETVTESLSEVIGQDNIIEHRTSEITDTAPKLEELSEQEVVSADGVMFQPKEESTEDLNPKISASVSDAFFDNAQTNECAAKATNSFSSSYIVEGYEGKEVNESVNVLSVHGDINALAHPEIILEDYRDHNRAKLDMLVPLDSFERIEGSEDNLKKPVCEENSSSFQSKQLAGGSVVSSSFMPILEEKLIVGSCKSVVVPEVPAECDISVPELTVIVDKNTRSGETEVPAYAGIVEMEKGLDAEEEGTIDISKDSLHMSLSNVGTEVLPDVSFVDSSVENKVNEPTALVDVPVAADCEKDTNENCGLVGAENSGGVIEDSIQDFGKTHESSSNSSGFQVNSVIDFSKDNNISEEGSPGGPIKENGLIKTESVLEFSTNENGSSEVPAEENVSSNTEPGSEFSSNFHESRVAAKDVTDGSNVKVADIVHTNLDTVSELSRAGTGDSNIREDINKKTNGSNTIQMECTNKISTATESSHGEDTEISHRVSGPHIMQETAVSQISADAAVEENGLRGIGGAMSTTGTSETLQTEADDHTTKPIFGTADISIDSCSRTDSLDAHWGSVSVLSVQSDAPTAIDAETIPSNDHTKKLKAESDSFDPAEKVNGIEVKAVQNVQEKSPGRKKNEEIIEKVTNWSSGGTVKRHIPLKSLINETEPAPMAQNGDAAAEGNGVKARTVNSILGTESPAAQATAREWNSPARYQTEIEGGKRKVKGRPIWAQFMCCSSVN